jgi:hypothetical protein
MLWLLHMLALGRALLQACAWVQVEAASPWGRTSCASMPAWIIRHLLLLLLLLAVVPALRRAVPPPGALVVVAMATCSVEKVRHHLRPLQLLGHVARHWCLHVGPWHSMLLCAGQMVQHGALWVEVRRVAGIVAWRAVVVVERGVRSRRLEVVVWEGWVACDGQGSCVG